MRWARTSGSLPSDAKNPAGWAALAFLGWAGSAFCFYQKGSLSSGEAVPGADLLLRGYNALGSMVFVTLCAWCVFHLFEEMRTDCKPAVNRTAATTFGIYLIHDSLIIRPLLWYGWLQVGERQYPSPLMPLYAVLTVAGIFALCSLLDRLRQRLAEPAMLRLADRCAASFRARFYRKEQ